MPFVNRLVRPTIFIFSEVADAFITCQSDSHDNLKGFANTAACLWPTEGVQLLDHFSFALISHDAFCLIYAQ